MLHGKIEVNEIPVGCWQAVRSETLLNDTHRYTCELFYRDTQGRPMFAKFPVIHSEAAGAVVLAITVLDIGHALLKEYPKNSPNEFPV